MKAGLDWSARLPGIVGGRLFTPALLCPGLVLGATVLLFVLNAQAFRSGLYPPAWYDLAFALVCLAPPALIHVAARFGGRRSALLWGLWLPGIVLFWMRPWHDAEGWRLLGMTPVYVWTQAQSLVRAGWYQVSVPPQAVAVVSAVSLVLVAMAAVTVRPWFAFVAWTQAQGRARTDSRAGAGRAEGLPQARWASAREVAAGFSHPGGIVLGELTDPIDGTPGFDPGTPRTWRRQGRGRLITMDPERGNGHVVVIAASAGGKTAGIVIPNILHYEGPLVVIDPKGDLYARTREAREAKGFKARVINAGHGFDPFKLIAPLAPTTPSVYLTMAKTLMPLQSRSSDISEYFHEMSCSLFAALMAHFIEEESDNVAADISKFINRERATVIEKAKLIAAKHDLPLINDEMEGLAALDERTFPGVVKGISNKLAFVRFPDVASYGSSQESPDAHLAALEPDTDIFINVPTLAAKDFSSFPRLLIGAMYVASELLEQPDRPRTRRLFLIDEARVLGGMDALTNVRDAGRSIGMHLMLIYQSLGQLKEAWGGEAGADAWLDSCEARVVGAVGAARTASDIVTMLGRRTLTTRMAGSSASSPVMTPMGGSVSTSEQEQLREVPLMSAATLGQLPAHGSIIFTRRSKPILATKALYFTRKDMKTRVLSPDAVATELEATRRRDAVIKAMAKRAKKKDDGKPPGDGEATDGETEPPEGVVDTEAAPGSAGASPTEAGDAARPAEGTAPQTVAAALSGEVEQSDGLHSVQDEARQPQDPGDANAVMQEAAADLRKVAVLRATGQTVTSGAVAQATPDEEDAAAYSRPSGTDELDNDETDPDTRRTEVRTPTGQEAMDIGDTAEAGGAVGPGRAAEKPSVSDTEEGPIEADPGADPSDADAPLTAEEQGVLGMLQGCLEGARPQVKREAMQILRDVARTQDNPEQATSPEDRMSYPAPAGDLQAVHAADIPAAGSDTRVSGPSASAPLDASDIDPSSVKIDEGEYRPDIVAALAKAQDAEKTAGPDAAGTPADAADTEDPEIASERPPAPVSETAAATTPADATGTPDPAPIAQPQDAGNEAAAGEPETPSASANPVEEDARSTPHASEEATGAALETLLAPEQTEDHPEQGHTPFDVNATAVSPATDNTPGDAEEQPETAQRPASEDPTSNTPPDPASAATGTGAPAAKKKPRPYQRKPNRWEAEDVREAILPHAEDLFRRYIGEPVRAGNPEWRPKDNDAFSMNMRGDKRGQWNDFKAVLGGDIFDFVAVYLCGYAEAKDNFPKVLEAAADYAGLSPTHSLTPAERDARAARWAEAAAARKADAVREAVREAEENKALTHALRNLSTGIKDSPAETYLRARGIAGWPNAGLAWLPPLTEHLDGAMLEKVHTPEHGALVVWAQNGKDKVGGQRILLNPDGTRVSGEITKPAFGRIGGAPARFSFGATPAPTDPVIVAEGPETALAILHALSQTGRGVNSVWAVFGVSSWASAPLPTDRPVILAPDRDAPGSPADKAFRKAVEYHQARGVALTIALAPEPEGSKRDLADTLKDRGAEAVRDAIAAAMPTEGDDRAEDTGGDQRAEAPRPAPEGVDQAEKDSPRDGKFLAAATSPAAPDVHPADTETKQPEATGSPPGAMPKSDDDGPDWIHEILSQTDD